MAGTASVQTRDKGTLAFIEQVGDLSAEIRSAMLAIADDRLAAFEQSVSRQEFLSGKLRELAIQVGPLPRSAPSSGIEADAQQDLSTRLRVTSATLQALNLQYAALLRHSGQSVRLMATLTNTYAQREKHPGSQLKRRTWSWEG